MGGWWQKKIICSCGKKYEVKKGTVQRKCRSGKNPHTQKSKNVHAKVPNKCMEYVPNLKKINIIEGVNDCMRSKKNV